MGIMFFGLSLNWALKQFLCNIPSLLVLEFSIKLKKKKSNELFNLMKDFRNLIIPSLPGLTF